MPDITRPNGESSNKAPATLKEQLHANLKYLKKLQVDMDRQVNKVNQEFIDQQPIKAEHVNQTKKYPNPLPEDELERLIANPGDNFGESQPPVAATSQDQSAPFSLPKIVHDVLDSNSMGSQKTVIGKEGMPKKALHPDSVGSNGNKSLLTKNSHDPNSNNNAFIHPDSTSSSRSNNQKDLIGNMNIKGNMDQLKKLMKTMANDVQESNVAIVHRQKERHEKEMKKLKGDKKKKERNDKQQ